MDYHQNQNCRMKYINQIESCLLRQNHEIVQDFVRIITKNGEKSKKFFRTMWNQMFLMCVNCFSFLFQKFICDFLRLLNNFERNNTKWFPFAREVSGLESSV